MRFGKLAKRNDYRTLQFVDYLTPELAAPPPASGNLRRIYQTVATDSPAQLFPMDGNDRFGDCTMAAVAHLLTVFHAYVGKLYVPTASETEALYFRLTGGQDRGLDMLTAMNYIRQNPFLGEVPLFAFVEINPANIVHIKQAINLFGGVFTGFHVQQNCIEEFESKKPWTPGPLIQEGHAVVLVDYTPDMLTALTWGDTQLATYPWATECVDECYAMLPMEAQTPGYCPGFGMRKLKRHLHAVTN